MQRIQSPRGLHIAWWKHQIYSPARWRRLHSPIRCRCLADNRSRNEDAKLQFSTEILWSSCHELANYQNVTSMSRIAHVIDGHSEISSWIWPVRVGFLYWGRGLDGFNLSNPSKLREICQFSLRTGQTCQPGSMGRRVDPGRPVRHSQA